MYEKVARQLFKARLKDHPVADAHRRVAMARGREGKLRKIWVSPSLELDLNLWLYVVSCCSIMTFGVEARLLNDRTRKILRGVNAPMLSHITRRSIGEESATRSNRAWCAKQHSYNTCNRNAITPNEEDKIPQDVCSFDIIEWLRSRRLKWPGHTYYEYGREETNSKSITSHLSVPTGWWYHDGHAQGMQIMERVAPDGSK